MTLDLNKDPTIQPGTIKPESESGPLLTLAVPTYNRQSFLAIFLAGIAPQLAGQSRVELLISDNASPDGTGELVRSYQANGTPIRYIRNEVNVGADRNILQCFEQASGKYVWICGDDDVVEPTGLSRVLAHLESEPEYDLVFLEARGFQGEYSPHVPKAPERVTVFTRAEDAARHVHVFFTFITGIIVNKQRVSHFPHRPFAELADTNLVQLSWTYTAVEHHRRSLMIHTPLVATLANNTGGYALFKVFGTNLKRVTDEWISSERVRSAIFHGALLAFFPWFLVKREGGPKFTAEDPEKILRPLYGKYVHYWIFSYPIMKLPPRLGRAWFFLVRLINRGDKWLGRPLVGSLFF
jgi:abequosyltransferase